MGSYKFILVMMIDHLNMSLLKAKFVKSSTLIIATIFSIFSQFKENKTSKNPSNFDAKNLELGEA